jgi:hypothetical protein
MHWKFRFNFVGFLLIFELEIQVSEYHSERLVVIAFKFSGYFFQVSDIIPVNYKVFMLLRVKLTCSIELSALCCTTLGCITSTVVD